MNCLNEKINKLDKKAVTSYSELHGRYERNSIVYNIRNINGGQIKYAKVDVELPAREIFKGVTYEKSDFTAISSHIMRDFSVATHLANDSMQQSESKVEKGFFVVYKFGNRVLQNSAVRITNDAVTLEITVRLPCNTTPYTGKKPTKGVISAKAVKLLLTKNLPSLAENFLESFDHHALLRSIRLWRNQEHIRIFLAQNGYVSFIANGSVLPRKGKTDYKDPKGAVPFRSPKSMEISIRLPDGKEISGMGIPKGITLITGDAYHGKSTIIEAIREGVYNHAIGDGREYVITEKSAMTIEAEDGRSIRNTDISFFLKKLPRKNIHPTHFSTENASGSTSQAAAVAEAVESGCKVMLFDEDRSANNFMYKDNKMRSVIKDASTCPFIDNSRMFYEKYGISSIIVVGASGEYFSIADRVILSHEFNVSEYTDYEKRNVQGNNNFSLRKRTVNFEELQQICLRRVIEIKDDFTIKFGSDVIKVSEIIPNITRGQLDFICSFIYYLTVIENLPSENLRKCVLNLYEKLEANGFEMIHQNGLRGAFGVIEYVRPEDILSIIFRMKSIGFE